METAKVVLITGLTAASAEALLPALYEAFRINPVAERTSNGESFQITTEQELDDAWEYHIKAWAYGFVTGFNKGRK